MVGLLVVFRLIGALFAQAAMAAAVFALAAPMDIGWQPPWLRVGAAEAASMRAPSAPPPLSAEIIVFAPKAQGAEVLAIAARAQIQPADVASDDSAGQSPGLPLAAEAGSWAAPGAYAFSPYPDTQGILVVNAPDGAYGAVVTQVLNQREILVDCAGLTGDGSIVRGALVRDVSGSGDWSAVRIWDVGARALGARVYNSDGFIRTQYPER